MIKLFCGYDEREAEGYAAFTRSVLRRASVPVEIHRLDDCGMPHGSNAFTLSRFLVPYLCNFEGWAIYCDASDMLVLADIGELADLYSPSYAVQVVKHDYRTRNRIKYRGTDMACPNLDYPRKNWASVMLMNCAHPAWAGLFPHVVEAARMRDLLQLTFIKDHDIGELPGVWNRLVDEGQPVEGGKLLHWTAGIPAFSLYQHAPGAELWRAEARP